MAESVVNTDRSGHWGDAKASIFRGCVVVPPSTDAAYWRDIVTPAAAAAGLDVVDIDQGLPSDRATFDTLYITNDMRVAAPLEPTDWVVILSRPHTGGGGDPATLVHAAGIFAWLSTLPAKALILTDYELMDSVKPLVLFDRIEIDHQAAALKAWQMESYPASMALSLYSRGLPQVGSSCEWVQGVFFYDKSAQVEGASPGLLDIAGRARRLVSGPHLALPTGSWRAVATFSVDEMACFRRYRMEWGSASGFTHVDFSPGRPGIFSLEIHHEWRKPEPAELHLEMLESALVGRVEFLGATVEMLTSTH